MENKLPGVQQGAWFYYVDKYGIYWSNMLAY